MKVDRTFRRHWRLGLALAAHRIERRLGRHLTDSELGRLSAIGGDPLNLRELWLRHGGRLEVRDGKLFLSETLVRGGKVVGQIQPRR